MVQPQLLVICLLSFVLSIVKAVPFPKQVGLQAPEQ